MFETYWLARRSLPLLHRAAFNFRRTERVCAAASNSLAGILQLIQPDISGAALMRGKTGNRTR
jgi:hypothetical protein